MKTTFGIILIIAPAVLALWPDIKKVINQLKTRRYEKSN